MKKQDVIERLRPHFEAAVRNRTGVSFLLSEVEQQVFDDHDLEMLMVETGYRAMCDSQHPNQPLTRFST
jgi:hypothetical protein